MVGLKQASYMFYTAYPINVWRRNVLILAIMIWNLQSGLLEYKASYFYSKTVGEIYRGNVAMSGSIDIKNLASSPPSPIAKKNREEKMKIINIFSGTPKILKWYLKNPKTINITLIDNQKLTIQTDSL